VDEAAPSVLVALAAALVPCGLPAPAFQVEVSLRQVRLLAPDKQPRGKAGPHAAHVLAERIVACVARPLQNLNLLLTLEPCAPVRRVRRLDGLDSLHIITHGLLDIMACCQAPVDVARSTREALMRWPPFSTARFR
jgi:hypothetical protein